MMLIRARCGAQSRPSPRPNEISIFSLRMLRSSQSADGAAENTKPRVLLRQFCFDRIFLSICRSLKPIGAVRWRSMLGWPPTQSKKTPRRIRKQQRNVLKWSSQPERNVWKWNETPVLNVWNWNKKPKRICWILNVRWFRRWIENGPDGEKVG